MEKTNRNWAGFVYQALEPVGWREQNDHATDGVSVSGENVVDGRFFSGNEL